MTPTWYGPAQWTTDCATCDAWWFPPDEPLTAD